MMLIEDRDWVEKPLQVAAYGAGTQSSAKLLWIADGLLPKPDLVLHSNTMAEMPSTENLISEWARDFVENVLGIPFVVVESHRGSIYDDYYAKGAIPIMGVRSCTDNFKIAPQRRFIRTIVGKKNGVLLAECWLGITTDEERRRSESNVKWCGLKYPLLDQMRVSRQDCIDRLEEEGLKVDKSGCYHCPYAGTTFYRDLRDNHPNLFEKALALEARAEQVVLERTGKPLRMGLVQGKKLSMLDSIELPDSTCDSGAGCFI
jgi:3'-phosphoadenosine 5'-phosphosulfate sulfotransferase (PAPS reductase)/FAD synthetase